MWKKIRPYVISIAISLAVGGLSALLSAKNMDLYGQIKTPALTPPSFLFPVVWTVLFVLMGISAARVWIRLDTDPAAGKDGLASYAASLCVNFFWPIFFFNFRIFLFSFFWLLLLWVLVLRTVAYYYHVDRTAAFLQIPYILWVTFAGYLNLSIALLNR